MNRGADVAWWLAVMVVVLSLAAAVVSGVVQVSRVQP